MKRLVLALPLALLGLLAARPAAAGTQAFDARMQPVLEQYLKIHDALASDSLEGVRPAAERIVALAGKVDPSTVSGEHAEHFAKVPANVEKAAASLAQASDLTAARAAFKDLSKPMAMWASMSEPEGVSVVYCSMARGSWLQKGTDVENPYYGASMLTCGEIVGGAGQGQASGHMDGHMKGHMEGHGQAANGGHGRH